MPPLSPSPCNWETFRKPKPVQHASLSQNRSHSKNLESEEKTSVKTPVGTHDILCRMNGITRTLGIRFLCKHIKCGRFGQHWFSRFLQIKPHSFLQIHRVFTHTFKPSPGPFLFTVQLHGKGALALR